MWPEPGPLRVGPWKRAASPPASFPDACPTIGGSATARPCCRRMLGGARLEGLRRVVHQLLAAPLYGEGEPLGCWPCRSDAGELTVLEAVTIVQPPADVIPVDQENGLFYSFQGSLVELIARDLASVKDEREVKHCRHPSHSAGLPGDRLEHWSRPIAPSQEEASVTVQEQFTCQQVRPG